MKAGIHRSADTLRCRAPCLQEARHPAGQMSRNSCTKLLTRANAPLEDHLARLLHKPNGAGVTRPCWRRYGPRCGPWNRLPRPGARIYAGDKAGHGSQSGIDVAPAIPRRRPAAVRRPRGTGCDHLRRHLGLHLAATATGLRRLLADGPPPLHRLVRGAGVGQAAPRDVGPARRERRAGLVALRYRLGQCPGCKWGP